MLPITGEITKPITYEITSTDGAPIPALDLNFITSAFPSTITFTRASSATYFDSIGTLQTASNDVARLDYNPVTLAPRGLLIEEQRTNVLTYSAEFDNAAWSKNECTITANAIVAPDGTSAGDKIVESVNNTTHWVFVNPSYTSGTTYNASVYAKAGERTQIHLQVGGTSAFGALTNAIFDLSTQTVVSSSNSPTTSITDVGNGWFRLTVSKTATATASPQLQIGLASGNTSTYTGDGTSGAYIWGAQLEAGAFATSYIPTTAASATRNADAASMTGTNFSSWYNATEGTLFVQGSGRSDASARYAVSINDNTLNEFLGIRTINNLSSAGIDGGVAQWGLLGGAYTSNDMFKAALAYAANNIAFCVNAAAPATDTAATLPTVNQMQIGAAPGLAMWNGYIRQISFYPRRLANAQLQSITS